MAEVAHTLYIHECGDCGKLFIMDDDEGFSSCCTCLNNTFKGEIDINVIKIKGTKLSMIISDFKKVED